MSRSNRLRSSERFSSVAIGDGVYAVVAESDLTRVVQ